MFICGMSLLIFHNLLQLLDKSENIYFLLPTTKLNKITLPQLFLLEPYWVILVLIIVGWSFVFFSPNESESNYFITFSIADLKMTRSMKKGIHYPTWGLIVIKSLYEAHHP